MKSSLLVSLACALACAAAPAQGTDWGLGAKFGLGAVLSGREPQMGTPAMNAGFWLERKLGKNSSVFAEVSYHYFRANDHEVTQFGTGYYPAIGANPAGTGFITKYRSADTRKDNLDGYGLNLGYRYALTEEFSIHGGLSMNQWISQQEVQGQVMVVNNTTAAATSIWKEGFSYVPAERSLQLGAFAGARYDLTQTAFLEGNFRYFGYKAVNYVPYAYTGQPAHTETASKSKVVLELNLGIRF